MAGFAIGWGNNMAQTEQNAAGGRGKKREPKQQKPDSAGGRGKQRERTKQQAAVPIK